MSKASEIIQAAHNASDICAAAVAANAIVDNYDVYGGVVYIFDDKSLIVVAGSKFAAHNSRKDFSLAPISDWHA